METPTTRPLGPARIVALALISLTDSWYENAQDGGGEEASVDGDASGAGLTSHL